MSRTPPESSPRSRRTLYLYLSLAVALSAVPLLALAGPERLGYDSLWNVFIARQDGWRRLWDEILATAHPPLFFLGLKATVAVFGASPVAYRLIPIFGTLGSTWLVGRIVHRLTGRLWLPAVAAFTFGSSLSAVTVGLDVRAYSLATFFILWACLAFLDLVEQAFSGPRRRARVTFVVMTSLALLTHYGSSLFLLSCFAAAVAPAVLDREYRHRLREARRHRLANLLTFGIPTAVLAIAYAGQIVSWSTRPFYHLPSFLFDAEREGALEFLWRNTRALFELFVPALEIQPFNWTLEATGPRLPDAVVGILVVASLAAVAWLGFRPLREGGADALARRIPAVLLAAMTALIIVLALLGRYPYGGKLRHQFFLFPFAVIVLTLLLDEVARRSNRRIAGLVVCLFALAGLLNAANWLTHHQRIGGGPHRVRMAPLDEPPPVPAAIYVDQSNLIHLFRHHHDWQWQFRRRLRGRGAVELWWVSKAGAGAFFVCRDRRWQLDLADRFTYVRLRHCLEATGGAPVAVFRWQPRGTPAGSQIPPTEELAGRAAAAGLIPDALLVKGGRAYAVFARR